VRVLSKVLQPIGEVDLDLSLFCEQYNSPGVSANGDEPMEGAGGVL
jgi:hypothetical protein